MDWLDSSLLLHMKVTQINPSENILKNTSQVLQKEAHRKANAYDRWFMISVNLYNICL